MKDPDDDTLFFTLWLIALVIYLVTCGVIIFYGESL